MTKKPKCTWEQIKLIQLKDKKKMLFSNDISICFSGPNEGFCVFEIRVNATKITVFTFWTTHSRH